MTESIPLFEIDWEIDDIQNVVDSVGRGSYWAKGPYVDEFSQRLEQYFGREHAVLFNSGTSALFAALVASGLEERDEVIVPSFTFIATANAVRLAGGTPVFTDVERTTFGLDPDIVRDRISEQTRAIMPVHCYGTPCKIDELQAIADEHDLLLIEDAAEAHGASLDGQKVGTFGEMAALSFCQNKIVSTGEGGAVITDDDDLAAELRLFQSHGRPSDEYFESTGSGQYVSLGGNFRMPDIVASLGCSQQERINHMIDERRTAAQKLNERIESIDGVTPHIGLEEGTHVYQLYTVVLNKEIDREIVIDELDEHGVASKIYWDPPVHATEYYRETKEKAPKLPTTEYLSKRVLSLPMHANLSDSDIKRITNSLAEAVSLATQR